MENTQYNIQVGQFYKVVNADKTIDVLRIKECTYSKGFCDIQEDDSFIFCVFYESDAVKYLEERKAELIEEIDAYIIMANNKLAENKLYHNFYKDFEHENCVIMCVYGDWKHEHLATRNILEKYFNCEIEQIPNDYSPECDCFYADYLVRFIGVK